MTASRGACAVPVSLHLAELANVPSRDADSRDALLATAIPVLLASPAIKREIGEAAVATLDETLRAEVCTRAERMPAARGCGERMPYASDTRIEDARAPIPVCALCALDAPTDAPPVVTLRAQLPGFIASLNGSLHAAKVRLPLGEAACTLFGCTGLVDPMIGRLQAVVLVLILLDVLLLCVGASAASWAVVRRRRRRQPRGQLAPSSATS